MTLKIIQALAEEKQPAFDHHTHPRFYAEDSLDPQTFSINVQGIGPVPLPLNMSTIERLMTVAAPAKFGLREQTLLDKKVRDTQEISVDQLQVMYDDTAMRAMLDTMRGRLGLSDHARLTPHLYNLLIYSEGQFFKPHQDSEKN